MNSRERNLLLLLVLVALVTSPWWPIWNNDSGVNELGLERESLRQFKSLQQDQADMPKLNLSVLAEDRTPFTGSQRNLFDYGNVRQEDDFVEEDPVVEEDEPEASPENIYIQSMQAQAEQEQEKPDRNRGLKAYEVLGIFDRGDAKFATFQWKEQIFVGTIGDVINNKFRIEDIDQTGVEIYVLDGEFQQRLTLKSPAEPQGEF